MTVAQRQPADLAARALAMHVAGYDCAVIAVHCRMSLEAVAVIVDAAGWPAVAGKTWFAPEFCPAMQAVATVMWLAGVPMLAIGAALRLDRLAMRRMRERLRWPARENPCQIALKVLPPLPPVAPYVPENAGPAPVTNNPALFVPPPPANDVRPVAVPVAVPAPKVVALPPPRFATCQWIENDGPPWQWCGEPTRPASEGVPASAYCVDHHRRCYVKVRDLRERAAA
jgi:hypothetical protein